MSKLAGLRPEKIETPLDRIQNTVAIVSAMLLSIGARVYHSGHDAQWLIPGVFVFYMVMETSAVTVFLHRFITHGSWKPVNPTGPFIRFCLWWARSGGVEYWVWARNHRWHHEHTDTPMDCYTPQEDNPYTHQPKLKAPRPWNFPMNGLSYRNFSNWLKKNMKQWTDLVASNENAARTQANIDSLEWAKETYGALGRANLINLVVFAIIAVPQAMQIGGWKGLLFYVIAPEAILGNKFVLYLLGGYFINYYGHLAESLFGHQSNIPWYIMLITLFMFGEGWHEFHHDAQYSARFHPWLDPGWWEICVCVACHLIERSSVVVAEPVKDEPRTFRLVMAFAA